jgi:hypothetical protein
VLGDAWGEAQTLVGLGSLAANRENDLPKARQYREECLAIHRRLGSRVAIADSLIRLAEILARQGEAAEAAATLQEGLQTARGLGCPWRIAHARMAQAELALRQDDLGSARAGYEEGLALFRAQQAPREIAAALEHVARVACRQGEYRASWARFREALGVRWELLRSTEVGATSRQYQDLAGIAGCLEGLAEIANATTCPARAARFLEAAAVARAARQCSSSETWSADATASLEGIVVETLTEDPVVLGPLSVSRTS